MCSNTLPHTRKNTYTCLLHGKQLFQALLLAFACNSCNWVRYRALGIDHCSGKDYIFDSNCSPLEILLRSATRGKTPETACSVGTPRPIAPKVRIQLQTSGASKRPTTVSQEAIMSNSSNTEFNLSSTTGNQSSAQTESSGGSTVHSLPAPHAFLRNRPGDGTPGSRSMSSGSRVHSVEPYPVSSVTRNRSVPPSRPALPMVVRAPPSVEQVMEAEWSQLLNG